nr:hypothetical protein [Tanacetum cinerariifolium]
MFKQRDDPIDAIKKIMSFLSIVIPSCFSSTNNQLRNFSNPRQQAIIDDGRVTFQPIKGRQTSFAAGEGHMARQCPKPKRKMDATWFSDKVFLVEAQGNGKVLNEEDWNSWQILELLKVQLHRWSSHTMQRIKQMIWMHKILNVTTSLQPRQFLHIRCSLRGTTLCKKSYWHAKSKPMLYDGSVIAKETNVISIVDPEETLMLEEESRSKMLLKQSDPMVLKQKVNTELINYAELNRLSKDFGKCFIPQQELFDEQALHHNID